MISKLNECYKRIETLCKRKNKTTASHKEWEKVRKEVYSEIDKESK